MFDLRTVFGLVVAVVALVPTAAPAFENKSLRAASSSIVADELRRHVEVLANDTFEGRAAGSRGGRAAAGYLVEQLKRFGLKPAGRPATSYYQPFGAGYQNILGVLEGSDPELKRQYVLVGAHYDHVGYGNAQNSNGPIGYIHNGADDNASGDAAMLEIIQGLSMLAERPKRSILFAFWDCEENDLNGSRHWMASPTVPREQLTLAFNMDMVGRLGKKPLEIIGSRSAWGLRRFVAEHNDITSLPLEFTWEMKRNSDHYSFYSQGIPVLMIHTGLHNDYHRPSDDAEKLNYDGMESIARLIFELVYAEAEAERRPAYRSASRLEDPAGQRRLETPLPLGRGRLGISWDTNDTANPGLRIVEVTPRSAAARAGLAVGDRLVRINGVTIDDANDLRAMVLGAKNPMQAEIVRAGAEEPTELSIELDDQPVRLGISWREDAGEPGTMIVVQVIPGSNAERAGIRVHDRVYQIAGRNFKDGNEFIARVAESAGPIELTVERAGRVSTVVVRDWAK